MADAIRGGALARAEPNVPATRASLSIAYMLKASLPLHSLRAQALDVPAQMDLHL
jgi:hypothetical protein